MSENINTMDYWDKRFEGSWEENLGNTQTRTFAEKSLGRLPEWLYQSIKKNSMTIKDAGCAEGDATALLKEVFPTSSVSGFDFSKKAVEVAQGRYPHVSFEQGDLTDLKTRSDVFFCSNVLEHFTEPHKIARNILEQTNYYAILAVPFRERYLCEEHMYRFDFEEFPVVWNDFYLAHAAVIPESEFATEIWSGGDQVVVVYAHRDTLTDREKEQIISFDGFSSALRAEKETTKKLVDFLKEKEIKDIEERLEAKKVEEELEEAKKTIERQQALIERKEEEEKETQVKMDELIKTNKKLDNDFYYTNAELYRVKQTNAWKVGEKYYELKDKSKVHYVGKAARVLKRDGVKTLARMVKQKVKRDIKNVTNQEVHKKQLREILQEYPDRPIVVLPTLIDWNVPLFQRPQHIAMNMAREGYLYFYGSCNRYDKVDGFEKVEDSCFVTNLSEHTMMELLKEEKREKVLHLYSTDNTRSFDYVTEAKKNGFRVLYEYVDEMSEEISGQAISEEIYRKHRNILADEELFVVSTADKLHDEVLAMRKENCLLATNGVNMEHFTQGVLETPEEMKKVVEKNKPIIGYFGAFAKWFDYPLVEKIAKEHPEWEVVLIGSDYDGSIKESNISRYANIHVFGPIQYQDLPKYAQHFTVSTIPFLINDITESTSPVKLFEYMALQKGIVTTGMPECRKYESVLIGEDHDHFVKQIEVALEKNNDHAYLELMLEEAKQNTWRQKAKDIKELMKQEN